MKHDEQPNRQALRDELRAVADSVDSVGAWAVVRVAGSWELLHEGETMSIYLDEARALRALGYVSGRRVA